MKSYVSELGLSVGLGVLLCLLCSPVIDMAAAAQPGASGADDGDSYLRYAHPTIREPFVDLLNLGVPAELENQHLAALGYVDVTQGPFRADPTGKQDSTQAVQAAVLFARDHQMACFFRAGSYLISDTLSCTQQLYRRANGRVFGGNRFPNMLVGSRAGSQRPRLMLAPRADGFGNPAKPKIFLHFWSRGYKNPTTADRVSDGLPPEVEQPNIGMNQMLVNLDLDAGHAVPLVRTADAADAETVLAFLGFYTPANVEGAQSLHWRSGGRSIFRGVEVHGRSGVPPAPVVISGHGGGNWYNFRDGSARLLVDHAQGPLQFYQFSVQQVTSELHGAKHVSFFGTKYEGNNPMLTISDSDQIRVLGHGGNAKARAGAALFVFERTPNFLFANGVDGPTKIGTKSLSHWEGSTDPRLWHMLIDRPDGSVELKLPPLERPVLYQRGSPGEF